MVRPSIWVLFALKISLGIAVPIWNQVETEQKRAVVARLVQADALITKSDMRLLARDNLAPWQLTLMLKAQDERKAAIREARANVRRTNNIGVAIDLAVWTGFAFLMTSATVLTTLELQKSIAAGKKVKAGKWWLREWVVLARTIAGYQSDIEAAEQQLKDAFTEYKENIGVAQKQLDISTSAQLLVELPPSIGSQAIVITANPALEKITGYSAEELELIELNKIVPDADHRFHIRGEGRRQGARIIGMGGYSDKAQVCPAHKIKSDIVGSARPVDVVCKDGSLRQCTLGVAYIGRATNGSDRYAGVLTDVTELMAAQRKVEEQSALARAVVNSMPSAIVFVKSIQGETGDSTFVYCNQAFEELAGCDPIGCSDKEMPWAEGAEGYREDDLRVLGGEVIEQRIERIDSEDKPLWWNTNKSAIELGGSRYVIGVSLNVTDLVEAKAKAEKMAEQIRVTSQIAVHDIKADLIALNKGSEVIEETSDELSNYYESADEIIAEGLETIAHFAKLNTRSALNAYEVLDQRNKLYNLEENIQIANCSVTDTVESLNAALSGSDGMLSVANDCEKWQQYKADKTFFLAALKNLVINGFVHNEAIAKRVELSVSCVGGDIVFKVSDNGVGMPPNYVADWGRDMGKSAQLSDRGGSGTGLFSVRQTISAIASKVPASIELESKLGKGSTFIIKVEAV